MAIPILTPSKVEPQSAAATPGSTNTNATAVNSQKRRIAVRHHFEEKGSELSLIGFGLDSVIEVASGAVLLWRLHHDLDRSRREQVERATLRIVGGCFVALALYILYESCSTLIGHKTPERSLPGIIVATVSLVVMPLLARAKRRVAAGIGSGAMTADSKQADFCTYLSAILLSGFTAECAVRLVVGRCGGEVGDGADHCQGRYESRQGCGKTADCSQQKCKIVVTFRLTP